MAIIWFEHFDLYGTSLTNLGLRGYTFTSGGSIHSPGRNGTHCYRSTANGNLSGVRLPIASRSVVGQGMAMFVESLPGQAGTSPSNMGFSFGLNATGFNVRVVINPDLGFSVYTANDTASNAGATLIGSTPANQYVLSSWFWVEARLTAGSPGSLALRVNGAEYTFPITIASVGAVGLGTLGPSVFQTGVARWDDWIVWDNTDTVANDFVGDTFVLIAPPNADGTPSNWAASTGTTRFNLIDESTPDDADFIRADNVGDVNEFAHTSVNLPVGSVAAIAVQGRALKTDAGASSIALGLSSGGATSMSGEQALTTGGVVYTHIANRNPNGNVPWTQETAQAARLRVQRIA